MVFSGIPFLYYFLPALVAVYFLVPVRFRNAVLLISSLVFYGWGEEIDGVITRNATYTAEFISEEELNAALATETETDAQKNEGCSSSVGGIAILAASVLSFAIFHNKKK